ncbi:3-methyl-2-oxobutanoate hydroxymethyltransferase [Roseovarius sp. 2305UL8-3]|uniref:3-methyl-2-oxobutanoate hydroxymethyltransferase n=1 Tax=Roseovarius conchicola TaxID=3121636 RepID=UPI0035283FE5
MKNMYTYGSQPTQRLLTIKDLQDNKGKQKYTMVTAVNRAEAEACAAAGIHTISCDYDDYDEVRAGAPSTLIITALPPTQFTTNDDILRAGFSAMERGSDGLYTCRGLRTIEMLAHEGFAVMSHIGVLPRHSTRYGGMKALGKTMQSALEVQERFRQLEDAGAVAVEVELIAGDALAEISKRSKLITFSIGAGGGGDVIFLYTNDICGETINPPRHAKSYGNLAAILKQAQAERIRALTAFQEDVQLGGFPKAQHSAKIPAEELEALIAEFDKN